MNMGEPLLAANLAFMVFAMCMACVTRHVGISLVFVLTGVVQAWLVIQGLKEMLGK